jgi:hypothetical protein
VLQPLASSPPSAASTAAPRGICGRLDGPSPPRRPAVLARYDRLALLIGMKSSRKHMQRQWRRSKRGPAHSRGAAPVRSGFLVTGWLTSDSQRSTHTPTPTAHFHPGSAIDIIPCETHRNWSLQLPLHLPERSAWVRQNVRFQEQSMHFGTAVPQLGRPATGVWRPGRGSGRRNFWADARQRRRDTAGGGWMPVGSGADAVVHIHARSWCRQHHAYCGHRRKNRISNGRGAAMTSCTVSSVPMPRTSTP